MSPLSFRSAVAAFSLWPMTALAEPVELKFSFFTSDRSEIYHASIKPLVDGVNGDARGLARIKVYFSGAINGIQSLDPQIVSDGIADLALIVPGRTPSRFPNSAILEMPGLFRNAHEAALTFTHLINNQALAGYEDFIVLAAFVSAAESIHSRKPINSLADLKGLTVRVNNATEADVLQKLGAIPVLMAINQTTEAVSRGTIQAATLPPSMLFEFGVGRVTRYHYLMEFGGVPNALIMNRKKFEALPRPVQTVIRKFSGEWLSEHSLAHFDAIDRRVLERLKSDPKRVVTSPTATDAAVIQAVFQTTIDEFARSSSANRDLLARVKTQIATLRRGE